MTSSSSRPRPRISVCDQANKNKSGNLCILEVSNKALVSLQVTSFTLQFVQTPPQWLHQQQQRPLSRPRRTQIPISQPQPIATSQHLQHVPEAVSTVASERSNVIANIHAATVSDPSWNASSRSAGVEPPRSLAPTWMARSWIAYTD